MAEETTLFGELEDVEKQLQAFASSAATMLAQIVSDIQLEDAHVLTLQTSINQLVAEVQLVNASLIQISAAQADQTVLLQKILRLVAPPPATQIVLTLGTPVKQ